MAQVTRQFRDDFETWAGHRIASREWTEAEMVEFKDMLRRDLEVGPDQLRAGVSAITAAGVEIPAVIDDCEERYRLWAAYFANEAAQIQESTPGTRSRAVENCPCRNF